MYDINKILNWRKSLHIVPLEILLNLQSNFPRFYKTWRSCLSLRRCYRFINSMFPNYTSIWHLKGGWTRDVKGRIIYRDASTYILLDRVGHSVSRSISRPASESAQQSLVALQVAKGKEAIEHIDAFFGEVKRVKGGNPRSYHLSIFSALSLTHIPFLPLPPYTSHTRTHIHTSLPTSPAWLTYLAIYQSTHQPTCNPDL